MNLIFSINPNSKGKIAIAILSTNNFDAKDVDINTIKFLDASPIKHSLKDFDKDGDKVIIELTEEASQLGPKPNNGKGNLSSR